MHATAVELFNGHARNRSTDGGLHLRNGDLVNVIRPDSLVQYPDHRTLRVVADGQIDLDFETVAGEHRKRLLRLLNSRIVDGDCVPRPDEVDSFRVQIIRYSALIKELVLDPHFA